MSEAEVLLEQAAPLPWKVRRGVGPDKFAPGGYRYVQFGPTEAKADGRGTDQLMPADARLIVYAVNRLPDYEAAVEALERMVATAEMFTDLNVNDDALVEARAALARLRESEPASVG